MSKEVISYVEIGASIETTSTAINGLLNIDKDVRLLKTQYDLDVKRDKLVKRTPEYNLKVLYRSVMGIKLRLTTLSPTSTRLDYTLIYNVKCLWGILIGYTILMVCLLGLPLLFLLGDSSSFVDDNEAYFVVIMLLVALICTIAPLWIVVIWQSREKTKDKQFHKLFLSRLERYIEIVTEHDYKAILN